MNFQLHPQFFCCIAAFCTAFLSVFNVSSGADPETAPVVDSAGVSITLQTALNESGQRGPDTDNFTIKPLSEFQFVSENSEGIQPRDWFAEHQSPPFDRVVSSHVVEIEPTGLMHTRLYFEQREIERCGSYNSCRFQTPQSAAKFFSRAILFPVTLIFTDPRELQCTNFECR